MSSRPYSTLTDGSLNQEASSHTRHAIFSDLRLYIAYYDRLGSTVLSKVLGTHTTAMLDSIAFGNFAIIHDSITTSLSIGNKVQSNLFLNLYHKSALVDVYFRSIISFSNKSYEQGLEYRMNALKGKNLDLSKNRITNFMTSCPETKPAWQVIGAPSIILDQNKSTPRTTISNFLYSVHELSSDVDSKEFITYLTKLQVELKNAFIRHFAYIAWLKQEYLVSDTWSNATNYDADPPDGAESEVAPIIQEIFTTIVWPSRPDIATALKKHIYMRLE